MSDIVERLRKKASGGPLGDEWDAWDACELCGEAADEIERLRAALVPCGPPPIIFGPPPRTTTTLPVGEGRAGLPASLSSEGIWPPPGQGKVE